jgi:hypothetical protein
MQMLMKVPNLVYPATTHDHQFLEKLNAMRIPFIFDKGYNDYKAFEHFSKKQVLLLE